MSKTERDSADKTLHVRRVVQTLAKRALHPRARFLRCAQNRISTPMSNQHAILRIANKQASTNVPAREIGAHIEFARISGRRDRFRDSKKLQLIAEFRIAAPAHKHCRASRFVFAFQFNRLEAQQKSGKAVRRDLRLTHHKSRRRNYARTYSQPRGEPQSRRIGNLKTVQKKKPGTNERIGRC